MKHAIFLVGTSHTLQLNDNQNFSEDRLTFHQFLRNLCRDYFIQAIAEEMNTDALLEKGCDESIPKMIADELTLSHCYADPNISVRNRLMILQENDVNAKGWLEAWTKQKIREQIQIEYVKRERYWIEQIIKHNVWPLLFVCGANHIESFSLLVQSAGLDMKIISKDWPN